MAPPKVRFLTKIYHPNIGEVYILCSGPSITDSHHQRNRRQAWSDLSRYTERRAPDLLSSIKMGSRRIQINGHRLSRFALFCCPSRRSSVPLTQTTRLLRTWQSIIRYATVPLAPSPCRAFDNEYSLQPMLITRRTPRAQKQRAEGGRSNTQVER